MEKSHQINKRLNFSFECRDSALSVDEQPLAQLDLEMKNLFEASEDGDNCSPCHTRSGRVYDSIEKKKRRMSSQKRIRKSIALRTISGSSSDSSENEMGSTDDIDSSFRMSRPPPLNYNKQAVSRLSGDWNNTSFNGIPSSPIASSHSPKTWSHRSEHPNSPIHSPSPPKRLFDNCVSSPISSPRVSLLHKGRLNFSGSDDSLAVRLPTSSPFSAAPTCKSTPNTKVKAANVNPFTPSAMMSTNKKRSRRTKSFSNQKSIVSINSNVELQKKLDFGMSSDSDMSDFEDEEPQPCKRVRVSDCNITRYQQEFLEVAEIANGEFGTVKKARHCLDGIVYAIKVTKNPIRNNSRDERVAMNEVFAHSSLIQHKNIVRYYNSWVENGKVYIQNEYCEGGTLAEKIEETRQVGRNFSEPELKRMTSNITKGLQYIHSKQLVHLDIKPENIFISLEQNTPSPPRRFDPASDSGAASGDHFELQEERLSSDEHYKIGDLGHVVPIFEGEMSPEEGDCRYMAPEFLEMEMDRAHLTKADIFSLGLTLYEAASLKPLPKNSMDDSKYENIKGGDLPYLDMYSRDFNNLIRSMVNPDPLLRPSAAKILTSGFLNPGINKSRHQLYKELKETREKLFLLEQQLRRDVNPL